jgi:prolipoprotein diacylglyceryl transferase
MRLINPGPNRPVRLRFVLAVLASIPSPDSGIVELGPLKLHMYGLMLAIGILVAIKWTDVRWHKTGLAPPDAATVIAFWVVIGGIVGARVYHLFTGYDWDAGGIAGTVKIWEGGLSIWGAVIGGMLAVVLTTRFRHIDTLVMTDCIAPALAAAQAIGRWGNWWNQEVFGRPTDLPWGLEIDPWRRPIEYSASETFHPTYLYESLYCLAIVGVLLAVERRFPLKRGQVFALYVPLYCAGRFVLENMRSDPASRLGPLRFNAWVCVAGVIGGAIYFWWLGRRSTPTPPTGIVTSDTTPEGGDRDG